MKAINRLLAACRYSWHGLRTTYRTEAAFRQEVYLAVVLIPLACWLEVSNAERALLILTVLLLPVVELLNTAIEAVVDLLSPEQHPLAKTAKDAGSAAVGIALVAMVAVWLIILLPKWL